jgi:hypothetical protein
VKIASPGGPLVEHLDNCCILSLIDAGNFILLGHCLIDGLVIFEFTESTHVSKALFRNLAQVNVSNGVADFAGFQA